MLRPALRPAAQAFSLCSLLTCGALAQTASSGGLIPTPAWLKLGGEVRGRAESLDGIGFREGNDDGYYLHRLRLNVGIQPAWWLKFFIQGQDSRAPGYRAPQPATAVNTMDLRQGYVELGSFDNGPWLLRAGRQELSFGNERMVGAGNWGNVGRSFDAVRLAYHTKDARLDWFASSPVVPVNGKFDSPRTNNKFHGFYASFDKWIPKCTFEPYLFVKTNSRVRDELGGAGALHVWTAGARLDGKAPRRIDYGLELAFQAGHAAGDGIRAWAGHGRLGYSISKDAIAPRLIAEYDYASGDRAQRDGRRGAFDQLYPTNHFKYGTADLIAWKNIHDVMGGVEWKPRKLWKLNLDYHGFWLATIQDALYTEAGAVFVRNPNATSSHVGNEVDVQGTYRPYAYLQLGFGVAHMFAGQYLKESTPGHSYTTPYVMWIFSF